MTRIRCAWRFVLVVPEGADAAEILPSLARALEKDYAGQELHGGFEVDERSVRLDVEGTE